MLNYQRVNDGYALHSETETVFGVVLCGLNTFELSVFGALGMLQLSIPGCKSYKLMCSTRSEAVQPLTFLANTSDTNVNPIHHHWDVCF